MTMRIGLLLSGLVAALALHSVRAVEEAEYAPSLPSVKVNGETLSSDTIRNRYEFWLKVYKAPGKPLSKEFHDKLASISREQMVQQMAIRQHIDKNKLTLTPDALKEDLASFKADLLKQGKSFEDLLKSRAKTEDEFTAEFALRAAMTRAMAVEAEKDLDALKKAFEKEKETMAVRRVSQIRFTYEKSKYTQHPERPKEDAKKEADYAMERAKKGEDFTTLAKQLSDENVSKEQGGDLGWMAPTYVPKQIAAAVYALEKVGDIAALVESDQGFHILKMTDMKPEEQEFLAFKKQRIYLRSLAAENKLGKDAKVEVENAPEPKPVPKVEPKKSAADTK
ncbi:MAG: peptidylprolyl isomerase [Planctomycetota bacterium]